jgi:hypothetical protein
MEPNEIARKYRNLHPGYTLIGYAEAGLPVTELILNVHTIEYKELSPLFEFSLKAIKAGIDNADALSAFLGFDGSFTKGILSELIRSEDISFTGIGDDVNQKLRLTPKGQKVLEKAEYELPKEQTITLNFERTLHTTIDLHGEWTVPNRELRENGWLQIPAIPSRRIMVEDLKIEKIQRTVDEIGKRVRKPKRVILSIAAIEKQINRFRYAVALRYENSEGDNLIDFVIDGIVQPKLQAAFEKHKGPAKLESNNPNWFEPERLDERISKQMDHLLEQYATVSVDAEALLEEENSAQLRVAQAAETAEESPAESSQIELKEARLALEQTKEKILKTIEVRNLSVFDHPNILQEALVNSKERLLIISPWIRRKVVNEDFIRKIENLLKNNVEVLIGYGIGDEKCDQWPIRQLQNLVRNHRNFYFHDFGNTHAKVLISDSRFYVMGSFNWLSFKGDPGATFRDERSIMVSVPELIETTFVEQKRRFFEQN